MAAALLSLTSNKYIILLIMNVILLVSGTFMDVTPAILIFTPLFLPICQSFGMSTIQFGLILVYNLCIGNITPPVGNALFVGIKVGRTSLSKVMPYMLMYYVAIIGGLLLLELPAKVFEFAVPPLILFSALIIALNPRKKAAARDAVAQALPQSHQGERAARIASKTADGTLRNDPWWLWAGVSFVGVYSGYFGAAAGTLALAILDLGKIGPFHQINALKTVVGFGANISAAIMFIIRGSVDWPFAIMMCLGCTIGSAIAPPVTRHIPENIMRAAAVLTGIILAAKLGWSTYF